MQHIFIFEKKLLYLTGSHIINFAYPDKQTKIKFWHFNIDSSLNFRS